MALQVDIDVAPIVLQKNDCAPFAVVWIVEVLLLEARTRWEEAVLSGDATYVEYQRQVPWRLIPGIL